MFKDFNKLLAARLESGQQGELFGQKDLATQDRGALPYQVEEFVYWRRWLPVVSSNVASIRYDVGASRLEVEFKDQHGGGGSVYEYSGVDEDEARSFVFAASKGRWVWNHLRRAGVPYSLIWSTASSSLSPRFRSTRRAGRRAWKFPKATQRPIKRSA